MLHQRVLHTGELCTLKAIWYRRVQGSGTVWGAHRLDSGALPCCRVKPWPAAFRSLPLAASKTLIRKYGTLHPLFSQSVYRHSDERPGGHVVKSGCRVKSRAQGSALLYAVVPESNLAHPRYHCLFLFE
ncbi:hypothetical protein AAFF_G00097750 [Aldrovandia affinis]|uniref:Uncharacterized protein n=1 Tax=Aldrovandia affinis TaxID=143900 RepID=A0AAD7RVG1_9TELE|nr:hypothetical protein AAFF_G00097750 [Aldrovandia affinis]